MKRWVIVILGLMPLPLWAQLTTAVPFMAVAADARSVGMGETGVATRPDVNALYWNAAKYAFTDDKAGGALSYAPWMRETQKGMNLGALNAFYRFGKKHTLALGGRYFTYGKTEMLDDKGQHTGTVSPADFSVDLGYAFRVHPSWSVGIVLHYIHSDALAGVADAASGFAADVSVYFREKKSYFGKPVTWSAGLNLSNLGPKLSYGDGLDNNYLPANLRLGGGAALGICPGHELALTVELNKFLVPGIKTNTAGVNYLPDESWIKGMGSSFSDRFSSVAWAAGAEYSWSHWLKVRAGYHLRHKDWGDRRYVTCGLGTGYAGLALDVAYRIPADKESPFCNSWGVTVGYRIKNDK